MVAAATISSQLSELHFDGQAEHGPEKCQTKGSFTACSWSTKRRWEEKDSSAHKTRNPINLRKHKEKTADLEEASIFKGRHCLCPTPTPEGKVR